MGVVFNICDHAGDGVGRYAIGDIISYATCGTPPPFPVPNVNCPFRLLLVTNITEDQVGNWIAENTTITTGPDGEQIVTLVGRRIYALDTSRMTTAQRNSWNTSRYIETTLNVARRWVKNKVTGQYEG